MIYLLLVILVCFLSATECYKVFFCFSETRSYSVAQDGMKLTTKAKLILNLSDPPASASQVLGIIESHHAGASERYFSYFQKTKHLIY